MRQLFAWSRKYVRRSDWKDLALMNLCVCATGVMIGCALSEKAKKPALILSAAVFTATYIPIVMKLLKTISASRRKR